MFCPACGSEYRLGIVRCAVCDVALTERPPDSAGTPRRGGHHSACAAQPGDRFVTFCGFLAIEDARHARELLRAAGIPSEILIRDAEEADPEGRAREEYWLRLPIRSFETAAKILGYDESEPGDAQEEDESFACSACGARVADEDSVCPSCGQRFQD